MKTDKIRKGFLMLCAVFLTAATVGWSSDYTSTQAEYLCREVMDSNKSALSPGDPSSFKITRVNYEGGKYKFTVWFKCCDDNGRTWNRCAPVTLYEDSDGFYIKTFVDRTDSSQSVLRLKSGPVRTF